MLPDLGKTYDLLLLLRESEKNRKLFAPYAGAPGLTVKYGDLLDRGDVADCVRRSDLCIHIAAFVSPQADYHPDKAMKNNFGSVRNIIDAIREQGRTESYKLVNIGTVKALWAMLSYNLFYSFAYTIFNMSHGLMVPLSTRDGTARGALSVFNQITTIMMSGILVALVFPMLVMPMIGVDKSKWITLMCFLSITALPLTLLEYFFTKERVTEEKGETADSGLRFGEQFRLLFTDKYMVLMYVCFLIYTIGTTLKNLGLVYYCNYVLGTYNDGVTQMLVSVIGGIPMGIGIFAVWPLAKKSASAT